MLAAVTWRRVYLAITIVILLIPAAAMQITHEIAWGPEDFGAAALLLGSAWIGIEIAALMLSSSVARTLAALLIPLAVLAIWAHLAVGLWT